MPAKLIRDDLLESERVLSLPAEGRWLFVAIILIADDVGLFEATPFKLAKKADLKREHVDRLLPMLVDADLVRLYEGPGLRTFGFIPRYGQRLQIRRAKHPLPPVELLSGDDDAINKIKHLGIKSTVTHRDSPQSTVTHGDSRSEPEPEPEPKDITPPTPTVLVPPLGATPQAKGTKPEKPEGERLLAAKDLVELGVDPKHAADWLKVRKAKKAPLTQTAWEGVAREARLADITAAKAVQVSAENSWQGFKASWYARLEPPNGGSPSETPYQRGMRERYEEMTGKRKPVQTGEIIDMPGQLAIGGSA